MKGNSKKIKTGAQRVEQHRRSRRLAGLTEFRVWIKETDLSAVTELLQPFRNNAVNVLTDNKREEVKSSCELES